MSYWSERFPAGEKFVTWGRTIGEGDFMQLHNLTWSLDRIHTDKEYMQRETEFGERLLAGPCILACATGQASVDGLAQAFRRSGVRPVAHLGFDKVRFITPVRPGDTITVRSETMDVRPTSGNPNRAVVRLKFQTFNQRDEQVIDTIWIFMVEKVE